LVKQAAEHDLVDLDDRVPIVLTGTPGSLRGVLPLRNRGERRTVLRELAVVDPEGKVGLGPAAQRLSTTVLHPQQARAVPVSLAIDLATPPGEYRLTLHIADRERDLIVHVVESIEVEVAPNPLVIENRPRVPIRKSVVVTNRSNVPIAIGEIGAVVLDDELMACRSLRATAATLGETEDDEGVTIARMLTQLAREFRATFEQASRLRVRNTSGPIDLQLGELGKVDLEIEVPETLEPRTRFFGRIAIYNTDLELVVVPYRGAEEAPANKTPRARQASRSTRSAPSSRQRRTT
jgi:hypothetical protein